MQTETNYKVEILVDTDPTNPREFDCNIGTMVCFHRRYELGDRYHGYRSSDFNSWDELKQLIIKQVKPAVILPIYMYDHSGITISTQPFGCRFDSGQVGFIYIGKLKVMKEYSVKRISRKLKERLTEYLKGEVEYYDNYLTGETYGYKITKDGEEIDSCWGYYGYDDVKNVANAQLMYYKSKETISLQ